MKGSVLLISTLSAIILATGMYKEFCTPSLNSMQLSSKKLTILYSKWAAVHGKISQNPSELLFRKTQFVESLKKLPLFRAQNSEAIYDLSEHSDLTDQEFSAILKKTNPFNNLKGQGPSRKREQKDEGEHQEESQNFSEAFIIK